MNSLQQAATTFAWFFHQTMVVGGLGVGIFWLFIAVMTFFLVITFSRTPKSARSRLPWLISMPCCWIFVGFWGGLFWINSTPGYPAPAPAWVAWPTDYGLFVFAALAVLLIVMVRGARAFATLFVVLNLYFMLWMLFLSSMAITGVWL